MSNQVAQYEERYVAFLDIMGFKDMVYQSTEDQGVLERMKRALGHTDQVCRKNRGGEMSGKDLGKRVSVLSDSIVISYDMKKPGEACSVLLDLISICKDLLGEGIMVRGGVSVGKIVHGREQCYGPALIDAYLMEADLAIYPRVIVKKSVLESGLNCEENPALQLECAGDSVSGEMEHLLELLDIDADGEIYLDYLGQKDEYDNQEVCRSYMTGVRNFILCALELYTNKQQRIDRKYRWFKTYFNRTIEKFDGMEEAMRI